MSTDGPRHGPPLATVFDMDGILVNSEPFWQQAEVEVFGCVGLELERRDCRRTMGMRIDEVVGYWLQRRPWDTEAWPPERVAQSILDRVCALVRERGERRDGVASSLDFLSHRGQRLGLATSSPEVVIDAVLQSLSLQGRFEVTVSAQREERGKPDPGVYRTACRRLGVAPARCVAIEDSLAGLEAALAAGMRCVMVPDPSVADDARLRRADAVLESLEQLPGRWQELVDRPDGGGP